MFIATILSAGRNLTSRQKRRVLLDNFVGRKKKASELLANAAEVGWRLEPDNYNGGSDNALANRYNYSQFTSSYRKIKTMKNNTNTP